MKHDPQDAIDWAHDRAKDERTIDECLPDEKHPPLFPDESNVY